MSAQQAHPGSLSRAHLRIVTLLDELNDTVESVEHLTRQGDPEAAIRLVEQQRAALYEAVDTIAHEVATTQRRPLRVIKKQATALVAAAVLAVSGIAGAVGIMARDDAGTTTQPTDAVQRGARRGTVQSGTGPGAGTGNGGTGVGTTSAVAPNGNGSGGSSDLLGGIKPPVPPNDDHRGLIDRAGQVADDARRGNPQPPATDKPPLDIGALKPNHAGADTGSETAGGNGSR